MKKYSLSARLALASIMLAVSIPAMAEHFGVQVGAYRSLSDSTLEQASALGSVTKVSAGELTTVVIGQFESYESALQALDNIKANGFADAFVRRLPHSEPAPSDVSHAGDYESHSHGGVEHVHLPSDIEQRLARMTEEQRKDIVILDGKLHRKVGEQFIPLD